MNKPPASLETQRTQREEHFSFSVERTENENLQRFAKEISILTIPVRLLVFAFHRPCPPLEDQRKAKSIQELCDLSASAVKKRIKFTPI